MAYTSTALNSSQTVTLKASGAITDVRGKAVKISSEKVALAGAGEDVLGIALITNDETTASGADVDIQIKDIGMVLAGGTITAGAQLTPDANGKAVTAGEEDYVFGTALENGASGQLIRFIFARTGKIAAAAPSA